MDAHRGRLSAFVDGEHIGEVLRRDALWQEAPAKRLGVGRERGGELTAGFPLALEEVAACGHPLGFIAVPGGVTDEVEEVAGLAGQPVLPHRLSGP